MNANPLSAKLTKLLASSLDDPKLRTSLTALSEFYSVNAVNSRHNLRGDIERRGTEVNYQFLRELEKVNIVSTRSCLLCRLQIREVIHHLSRFGHGHHLIPRHCLLNFLAIPGTGGRDE
jgi:hypothetical protein